MNLKIESMDYHRNGVCGEGFYVVLFTDFGEKRKMIATVFNPTVAGEQVNTLCAVYDLAMLAEGNIRFGENSWRGDHYWSALKPLMKAWCLEHEGYELGG